jgi:hypothetical protein
VHDPNSLQELLRSLLPCGHSPSRPRLRHPLHYYTVPWATHLALPRFSRIGKKIRDPIESYSRGVPQTCSVEASLQLVLPQHSLFQAIMTRHGVFHGSVVAMFIIFNFDSLHLFLLDISFLLTCITGIQNS